MTILHKDTGLPLTAEQLEHDLDIHVNAYVDAANFLGKIRVMTRQIADKAEACRLIDAEITTYFDDAWDTDEKTYPYTKMPTPRMGGAKEDAHNG